MSMCKSPLIIKNSPARRAKELKMRHQMGNQAIR